jgi:hypothetical protein
MSVARPEFLLEVGIDGRFYQMSIDSGASVSVIKPGIVASEIRNTQTVASGITGTKVNGNTGGNIYGGKENIYPQIFDSFTR